jgi:hypothetical protein
MHNRWAVLGALTFARTVMVGIVIALPGGMIAQRFGDWRVVPSPCGRLLGRRNVDGDGTQLSGIAARYDGVPARLRHCPTPQPDG